MATKNSTESRKRSIAAKKGWADRKKKIKNVLVSSEVHILSILKSAGVGLKVSDIARYGNMAPETVKKYLLNLRKKGLVKSSKKGKRTYWMLV